MYNKTDGWTDAHFMKNNNTMVQFEQILDIYLIFI